ncbi:hypothetical protein [Dokdonella soli]|uniref:hypothetical protein n=1 Tax=Dokdonella soli TaxID=529810 RepID=UPI0031D715B1
MRMQLAMRWSMALLAPLALVTACYSASSYKGDGTLVDHGSRYWAKRYEVNLGSIDLAQPREWHFRAAGLPAREFVLGVIPDASDCSLLDSTVSILFEVKDEQGSSVIREEQPLRKLTWEKVLGHECKSPFGYVRGQAKEMPARNGDVSMQPIVTGADCGRGTYFSSRPAGIYEITIAVRVEGQSLPEAHMAKVVLKDDGANAKSCRK